MPTQDQTNRDGPVTTIRPFQIRGRFLTAVALRPEDAPVDAAFFEALDLQLRQTPQFYTDAPMVLDLDLATNLSDPEALRALIDALRARKLAVFGFQNAGPEQMRIATEAGLIPVSGGRDTPVREETRSRRRADAAARLHDPANKLVTVPVRSGQLIYAERGDLIVVGSVASGAELIASGNIHVYGRMRGRAMAGVDGNENARIFCQNLDAELLAIAGLYRTNEHLEEHLRRKAVQVFLRDQNLCVEALG